MNQTLYIAQKSGLAEKNCAVVVALLEEDCTIPFISRYRKDQTGNLDEVQIETIAKLSKEYDEIQKRKASILKAIQEQLALTPELKLKIEGSFDLAELEDLYLPFKKRKKTRADIARERGLEPLAKIIMAQKPDTDLDYISSKYISPEVANEDIAICGARDIIAEWMNENMYVRKQLRRLFQRYSTLETKAVKGADEKEEAQKFSQYFEWNESLAKAPAHRLLAMLRAETEGFIRIKIEVDQDQALDLVIQAVDKRTNAQTSAQIHLAAADSFKRLLAPALSNEALQQARNKAEAASINVFAQNLRQLLMSSPLGEKRILAIDPGFKSGCKIVCLDEKGDLLYNETVYPHAPQNQMPLAMKKVKSMVNAYHIEAIAIGNGTASRETEFFIKKIAFDRQVQVFVVSEAGASVYSASPIAREEFPNFDVTVRGAVSIGRRLSDPLAELVKIDPKAIGVGQYQHDVDQSKLKEELDAVVQKCVNAVGVNLNTASKHLLNYVSGIGDKLAANIVAYRSENGPFKSRAQLKKVPRLGEKAYQQAAAFVRISGGENPLDNSAVHPEAYAVVDKIAKDLKVPVGQLIGSRDTLSRIEASNYVSEQVGIHTVTDILKELEKPGLDPRKAAAVFEFDPNVRTISDIREGMVLPGIVNNITHFGCFVDLGIKESGLVHISQLKEGFVSDVNQVVKMHQHITVKVVEVDHPRKRIQLTMIL
jgi:protein Tex